MGGKANEITLKGVKCEYTGDISTEEYSSVTLRIKNGELEILLVGNGKMQSRRNLPPVGAIRIDPAILNMNRLHIKIGERKFLKLSGIPQDVLPKVVAFLEPFRTDSAGEAAQAAPTSRKTPNRGGFQPKNTTDTQASASKARKEDDFTALIKKTYNASKFKSATPEGSRGGIIPITRSTPGARNLLALVGTPTAARHSGPVLAPPARAVASGSYTLPRQPYHFVNSRQSSHYFGWSSSRTVSSVSPSASVSRSGGVRNIGNTCYMGAVLQCLVNLPLFTRALLEADGARLQPDAHLCQALVEVTRDKQNKRSVLDPSKVKRAMGLVDESFRTNDQQDAHEFLGQCLDRVKEEVKQGLHDGGAEADGNGPARATPSRFPSPTAPCPSTEVFETEVEHTVTCNSCGAESSHRAVYNNMSLDMPAKAAPNGYQLDDLLGLYFEPDHVDYTCDKCGGEKATVTHSITKLAPVIVLHLKRFRIVDFANGKIAKRKDRITFDGHTDMGFYCDASAAVRTSDVFPVAITPSDRGYMSAQKDGASSSSKRAIAPDESIDDDDPTARPSVRRKLDLDELNGGSDSNQLAWAIAESERYAAEQKKLEDDEMQRAIQMSLNEGIDPADLAAIIAESEELAGAAADEETADEPLRDIDLSALQARRTGVHAKQQYYLTSVVSHSGLTPFSGHYVTDAFDATESRWFRYNDSLVDPTSREKVLRSEAAQRDAYIYFLIHEKYAPVQLRT